MKITAAVVFDKAGPFKIEQVELCDPRADELLVEVAASGMCATDMHGRDAYYPTQFPKIFGHEGAGIVRAVGASPVKVATTLASATFQTWTSRSPSPAIKR